MSRSSSFIVAASTTSAGSRSSASGSPRVRPRSAPADKLGAAEPGAFVVCVDAIACPFAVKVRLLSQGML